MANSGTRYDFSVIHIDLVFIVYGAILQSYYGAIGYSTVEQPTKKGQKPTKRYKNEGV